MREGTPKPIHLKDYRPPAYLVDHIALEFDLEEESTRVKARLEIRRNPASDSDPILLLDGEELALISIRLDGTPLPPGRYAFENDQLSIENVPDRFVLETEVSIHPRENTRLDGLYVSKDMLCTQCEAEGFRRITFFPDRPDVMARFRVRLNADKTRYPVLLSNGNLTEQGDLAGGRHYAVWEDPIPKPCYLFALVAGRLEKKTARFVTASGKKVLLEVYVEAHDLDKCEYALECLKKAMRWDEQAYGREYDLERYMIVAVGHFNMGAMENKGLNIFNTQYVLAKPETATDDDFEHVLAVIGHEYFHNWTGNRITLRDWFQLSLKEGLTVFREQQFSAAEGSPGVRRIEDVKLLRSRQFPEDEGPLAHPVRPESYIEINNFYTMTVYEKGAEVIRMLHTLLGDEGFHRGMALYFERHDGQAVTCEDFIQAMEDANQVDLGQFMRWYTQAGTPRVEITPHYDEEGKILTLTCRQSTPPTPGQPHKEPLPIPLATALLDRQGQPLPLRLEGETTATGNERVLRLSGEKQSFRFLGVATRPVVSILRGFSAPVKLQIDRTMEELLFLWRHDSDPFNRWDAGQKLATTILLRQLDDEIPRLDPNLARGLEDLLTNPLPDLSFTALLLILPEEDTLAEALEVIDVEGIHRVREITRRKLALALEGRFLACYQTHHRPDEAHTTDARAIGRRRIKNVCLNYLATLDHDACRQIALEQFIRAGNMTDQLAALKAIVHHDHPAKSRCLEDFYRQWRQEPLVLNKWFAIQASDPSPDALARVGQLLAHPDFQLTNPNRVRSVLGAFSRQNPLHFHHRSGSGYRLLADYLLRLDRINPQIAARLAHPLTNWRRYDSRRQDLMRRQLERIHQAPELSRDLFEIVDKALHS